MDLLSKGSRCQDASKDQPPLPERIKNLLLALSRIPTNEGHEKLVRCLEGFHRHLQDKRKSINLLDLLPEILVQILSHLPSVRDLARAMVSCRLLQSVGRATKLRVNQVSLLHAEQLELEAVLKNVDKTSQKLWIVDFDATNDFHERTLLELVQAMPRLNWLAFERGWLGSLNWLQHHIPRVTLRDCRFGDCDITGALEFEVLDLEYESRPARRALTRRRFMPSPQELIDPLKNFMVGNPPYKAKLYPLLPIKQLVKVDKCLYLQDVEVNQLQRNAKCVVPYEFVLAYPDGTVLDNLEFACGDHKTHEGILRFLYDHGKDHVLNNPMERISQRLVSTFERHCVELMQENKMSFELVKKVRREMLKDRVRLTFYFNPKPTQSHDQGTEDSRVDAALTEMVAVRKEYLAFREDLCKVFTAMREKGYCKTATLLDLPDKVLLKIIHMLCFITDFFNLEKTCTRLRTLCLGSKATFRTVTTDELYENSLKSLQSKLDPHASSLTVRLWDAPEKLSRLLKSGHFKNLKCLTVSGNFPGYAYALDEHLFFVVPESVEKITFSEFSCFSPYWIESVLAKVNVVEMRNSKVSMPLWSSCLDLCGIVVDVSDKIWSILQLPLIGIKCERKDSFELTGPVKLNYLEKVAAVIPHEISLVTVEQEDKERVLYRNCFACGAGAAPEKLLSHAQDSIAELKRRNQKNLLAELGIKHLPDFFPWTRNMFSNDPPPFEGFKNECLNALKDILGVRFRPDLVDARMEVITQDRVRVTFIAK